MSGLIPFVRHNTMNDWIYDIDRLFEPFVQEHKTLNLQGDIEETADHILMSFDFPGMKEGDFKVKVDKDRLVISGERKREVKNGGENKENYTFYGRQYGTFNKSFLLPETVETTKIEADYRDGVLRVLLPKAAKKEENLIEVKVSKNASLFDKLLGAKN